MTNTVIAPGAQEESLKSEVPAKLDVIYESLRADIFACVQELHTSPDYILARRVINLKGGGALNNQKSGRKLFSHLHDAAFEKHDHYNCATCREAFAHYYGLVFISRTGVQVNPVANALESNGIDAPVKKVMSVDRNSVESTKIVLVDNINPSTGVDEVGGFHHFRFFTEEQVKESNLLGYIDHGATPGLLNYASKVSAENLRALINAIKATAGKTEHLGGILQFADFVEEIQTITGKENRELWIGQMLRTPKWGNLRHLSASFAGTILDMYLGGDSVQKIANFYLEKSDPALFKQKQADAKEGLLKATRDFLTKNEISGILSRRFAVIGLDNVPCDWTLAKSDEPVPVPDSGKGNVADAFDTLLAKTAKNAGIPNVDGLADLHAHYLTREDVKNNVLLRNKHRKVDMVSRKHYTDAILPHAVEVYVALDEYSKQRWVTLFTESAATPKSNTFFNLKRTREIEGYGVVNGLVLNDPIPMADVTKAIYGHFRYYMQVLNVVTIGDATALSVEGGKKISEGIFSRGGYPTIVGAEIANEHYGMAAAIRDVTEHIGVVATPEGHEGSEIFAGIMMDVHTTLVTIMKDGTVMVHAISSDN